jgi:transporter family-2 protein
LPWYAWASGALGLVIVGTIGYSTPRLGLVTALAVIVGAQFATGAIIDHFGLFGAEVRPLDLARVAGLCLILLGVWLTFHCPGGYFPAAGVERFAPAVSHSSVQWAAC